MSEKQSYFSSVTRGQVIAEFVLDNNGNPIYYHSDGHKNYKIVYKLQSDRANEIKKVIYRLDSSYYNPIRETRNRENNFELRTSTYGEYPLSVEVHFQDETVRDNFSITKLLKQTYQSTNNQQIMSAITNISQN